jgi:hypothetical protein
MKHLKESGHSYFGHMFVAFGHIVKLQVVSFKLLIHGIFPFIWEDTGLKNLGK